MLWLLLFPPLVLAQFPTDTCTVEGEACLADSDNILSSSPGVSDVAVCRQLCQDTEDCGYFTHFGADSFPLREHCILFAKCDSLTSCSDCRTEDIICSSPCGVNVEGPIADNDLEIIFGVTSEMDCKSYCSSNSECNVYTYHDEKDQLLPNFCILLTEVLQPLQECEHCRTGFPDCRNKTAGFCMFKVSDNNTLLTSYKFTEPGNTTVTLQTLGDCEITVVAVGGGGLGGDYSGGGSGYVNSTTTTVSSSLVVTVGGPGEHSGVITGQHTIISAAPGEDYYGHNGGDGYSGGGAGGFSNSYGDGGENGYDGCCDGRGGTGSGLDLSSISLQHFSLSPGSGGKKHVYDRYYRGGGGGGVLVDGEGPRDKSWDGEGYGGGMGGYYSYYETPGSPGPGIVLMEIKAKQ